MKNQNMSAKETVNKKEDFIDSIMKGYKKLDTVPDKKINKTLKDRVVYTLKQYDKDPNKVPKDILAQLAEDVATAVQKLVDKVVPMPAPVEASAKPKLGTGKKKETPVVQEPEDEEEEEETPPPAPTPKSNGKGGKVLVPAKKPEKKVETTPDLAEHQIPMATIFPDELENDDFGKLIACPDMYKTMEEIAEALEQGKTLILTTYWTTRHLKEHEYAKINEVPVPKKGFPHDLDTLQVIYVCTGIPRLYAISSYTEAIFYFTDEDLARLTVKSPNGGEEFTMRYSNGMEFEIYEAEETEE